MLQINVIIYEYLNQYSGITWRGRCKWGEQLEQLKKRQEKNLQPKS